MGMPTDPESPLFWSHLDELVKTSELVFDRPQGSLHPRYPDIVYPLDYGYLTNTSGGDGNEIDVWRGSRPDTRLGSVVCTVDLGKRDAELKLLLGCSPEDRALICDFYRTHGFGWWLVERPAG